MCAVKTRLQNIDGAVVTRMVLGLSLTFDHRIVDGAEAAAFLQKIQQVLETPYVLLVQ